MSTMGAEQRVETVPDLGKAQLGVYSDWKHAVQTQI